MNQYSFLDYLMLTLAAVVWWRFFYLAHSPPAGVDAETAEPAPPPSQSATTASTEAAQPLDDALAGICLAAGYADIDAFMEEARNIYEAVTAAFATGKLAPQAILLSDEVRDAFAAAIAARNDRGESVERTFIGFQGVTIAAAGMSGGYGWLDVRFDTEAVTAIRDGDGTVVAGDPQRVAAASEIWSFERDFRQRGNWVVTATGEA
jgi:predicted lipid-binding transport protein (Tim44 family)